MTPEKPDALEDLKRWRDCYADEATRSFLDFVVPAWEKEREFTRACVIQGGKLTALRAEVEKVAEEMRSVYEQSSKEDKQEVPWAWLKEWAARLRKALEV